MKKSPKLFLIPFVLVFLICTGLFFLLKNQSTESKASIISTGFIGYDLARAVTGDASQVRMLLKPGSEAHGFEPTPQDIIDIKSADLFIYVGGESEEWVTELLADNDIPSDKILRLMDVVELKEEELAEGMTASEHHHDHGETEEDHDHEDTEEDEHHEHKEVEYDEHIWTSVPNAIKLTEAIRDKLIRSADSTELSNRYTQNSATYTAKLQSLDQQIREIVASAKRKELVFGDRFPFRYFVDEYGLTYAAAFPGCSEQTEASSSTISYLVDKIKTDQIPVVLKIELTSDKLAQTIASETGAKVRELNAAHNVSQTDFDAGVTYADLVERNLTVLREALN